MTRGYLCCLAAVVIVGVALSNATGTGTASATESTSTMSLVRSSPTASAPPLDRADEPYLLFLYIMMDGRTQTEIWDSIETQTQECMVAQGWRYEVVPYAAVNRNPDYLASWNEIREFRLQYGYGLVEFPGATDPNDSYVEALSDGESDAYYLALVGSSNEYGEGTEGESCRGQAEAAVYASIPYYQPQYQDVVADFGAAIAADSDVQAANRAWSDCMRAAGFDIDDPGHAAGFVAMTFQGEPPSDEVMRFELEVAAEDVECFDSHVRGTSYHVAARILNEFVDEGRIPAELLNVRS